jgi:hypothetical protein
MIEDFDLFQREDPFDPFGVMLFKALQVLAFLFFIAVLAISPDASQGKVDPKAEFLITASWPDNHPDDIDLFVQDPVGNMVWYRRHEAGFMVLDRDNRGGANDSVIVHGERMRSPIRQETVTIRGIIPGEYTVDVYHFTALTGKPVPVSVKVEKLNPTLQLVDYSTVELDHGGEEKTAVRFTVDAKGAVSDVNHDPKSLLQTLYNPHRNGG